MAFYDMGRMERPYPDSHWRLRNCKCGSGNVAYLEYCAEQGVAWRVKCFACGHTVDKGRKVKHDAQADWNIEMAQNLVALNEATITAKQILAN